MNSVQTFFMLLQIRRFKRCRTSLLLLLVPVLMATSRVAQAQTFLVSNDGSNIVSQVSQQQGISLFASGFNGPNGMAIDRYGNLYVANFNDSTITKVTPGGVVSTFVSSGLNRPVGLVFDGSGNLYAANYANGNNGTVSKITPSGTVTTFTSVPFRPYGLTLGPNGDFFVACHVNGGYADSEIDEITPNGVVSRFASGLTQPVDLVFDKSGNLFVSEDNVNQIIKVTPSHVVSTFATNLQRPYGMTFGTNGDLYVCNYDASNILEFAPDGTSSTFVSGISKPSYIVGIPEPSSFILVSISLVAGVGVWLGRKARRIRRSRVRMNMECLGSEQKGEEHLSYEQQSLPASIGIVGNTTT